MKFSIVYGNHGESPVHVEDILKYIYDVIAENGHDVEYSKSIILGRINILLELFADSSANVIEAAVRNGVQFIVVATEFMTGDTFNDFGLLSEEAGGVYGKHEKWKQRHDNFLRVSELACAVWVVSDHQVAGYLQAIPAQKLHLLPFGYTEAYRVVEHKEDQEKNIDFLFTGSPTQWRDQYLSVLKKLGAHVVFCGPQTPSFIRNDLIARSKVCLSIKQYEQWKYPSATRPFFHVVNSSLMLTERYEGHSPMDDYITIIDGPLFVRECLENLLLGNFKKRGIEIMERYRAEQPVKEKIAALLDASLGHS